MIQKNKKKASENIGDASPSKKLKKSPKSSEPNLEKPSKPNKKFNQKNKKDDSKSAPKDQKIKTEKSKKVSFKSEKPADQSQTKDKNVSTKNGKFSPKSKPGFKPGVKGAKFKSFNKNKNANSNNKFEKPADWNEFKKKKKELQKKRKESRDNYDAIIKAKKIGETLRQKKENPEERKKDTEELHKLLGGQKSYVRFVLAHDMARIVQYQLKFSSEKIRREIAQELAPSTVEMLQSKYAKYCVKNLLKYGNTPTRSEVIKACYGNAIKLASHVVSAEIFDLAFKTYATPQQKRHLIQEFYGDIYKNKKDDSLTHVRDTYKDSPEMKNAILGSVKANLGRVLNKELLDSHLIQAVIMQFLQECSNEDRTEMISQLANHIVILSNSKEGSTAANICFWYGTNKDRKTIVKTFKDHILDVCKHEYAHNTIIAILDSIDDTVLLNKVLLSEIINDSTNLAQDEWGKKILLWLVAPVDTTHFHPTFLKELNEGREKCNSKKDPELRRKEILNYCIDGLLQKICDDTEVWMKNASIAMVTFAILKTGVGSKLEETYNKVVEIISNPDWVIKEGETEIPGVEHAGFHMVLKKLLQHGKDNKQLFAAALVDALTEKTLKKWLKADTSCNRSCFLLVHIFENSSEEIQNKLMEKMDKKYLKMLEEKQNNYKGASILLQKIKK